MTGPTLFACFALAGLLPAVAYSSYDQCSRPCDCEGIGWTRVAGIDMSNSQHKCPPNWKLFHSKGVRGCRRKVTTNTGCDSAIFKVNQRYSRVCGKLTAYQLGDPDAFLGAFGGSNIEQAYINGVLLTYGAAGSRTHSSLLLAIVSLMRLSR